MTNNNHKSISGMPSLSLFRLSLYLRYVKALECKGVESVSSKELSHRFSISSALVRKDLGFLGSLGKRGVGYDIAVLKNGLISALGIDKHWNVALVGAGRLGTALVRYTRRAEGPFRIAAILDKYPQRMTKARDLDMEVLHIDSLPEAVQERDIKIGIISVPGSAAQDVADKLVAAGVGAILNFAPAYIEAPDGIFVHNVDFIVYLENLAHHINTNSDIAD
ncbi:redox-sensing transcriptional repressor Rex [bacterium]|nr:redox-sensing transcriptional repressor Rex [bacterium]